MSPRRLPPVPRVGVVGATGVVGRVMLQILYERGFPASELRAFATARSAGTTVEFGTCSWEVEETTPEALAELDLVLLDTPDGPARELGTAAAGAGALVVDNSAAFRMDDGVPLVVPEVNPEAALASEGIIASPNCTTIGVVLPLAALHAEFGLESVVVASYQATSGAGKDGVAELKEQVLKVGEDVEALQTPSGAAAVPAGDVFPAPIAFNVVPQAGSVKDEGYTSEENKLLHETRKIMGLPSLAVTATCVRVPTVAGHGAAVHARFGSDVDLGRAVEVLAGAPGCELNDLPTALVAAGRDASYVGRVRADRFDPRALTFFCVCDNLRKGAALNAVQIAELVLRG